MRTKLCLLSSVALIAWFAVRESGSAETPAPGKQVPSSVTVKVKGDTGERKATVRFLLTLPADYEQAKEQRWPLVLFLHGAGERGEDLELVKKHGPPKQVAAGKQFPFVLVSPQCPSGIRWNPHELAKLIDSLANTYRIDRQRIYVTGLSMGGAGTWSLLAEYPGVAAAAIPICGRGDVAAAYKMAKTPIRVFVGAKDRAETVKNCEEMAAEIKKAGGDVDLKIYPDLPHDCWTVTYDNPDIMAWLLAQRLRQ